MVFEFPPTIQYICRNFSDIWIVFCLTWCFQFSLEFKCRPRYLAISGCGTGMSCKYIWWYGSLYRLVDFVSFNLIRLHFLHVGIRSSASWSISVASVCDSLATSYCCGVICKSSNSSIVGCWYIRYIEHIQDRAKYLHFLAVCLLYWCKTVIENCNGQRERYDCSSERRFPNIIVLNMWVRPLC